MFYRDPPQPKIPEETIRKFGSNGADAYLKALKRIVIELYFHKSQVCLAGKSGFLFTHMWFMNFKGDITMGLFRTF